VSNVRLRLSHNIARQRRPDVTTVMPWPYRIIYLLLLLLLHINFIVIILAYVENSAWSSVVYVYFAAAASPVDSRHMPCDNCGAFVAVNGGLCRRCLDLSYCFRCKRHLPTWCYDDDQSSICQVVFHKNMYLHVIFVFTFVLLFVCN